jgi:hypothetical protein
MVQHCAFIDDVRGYGALRSIGPRMSITGSEDDPPVDDDLRMDTGGELGESKGENSCW